MTSCADRLKEERLKLEMNQTEFGEVGGVLKGAQIKYEAGVRFPDSRYLEAIAAAGADVQYILTGVRSANALAPDEEMLLTGYRAIDSRGKSGVLALIGGLTQNSNSIGQQFNAPVHQVAGGDIVINNSNKPKR